MGEPARRRVTYCQLEHLWGFLNKRKELATGFNKTSEAREFSRRMWEEITLNLNSHNDGAVKDWKGWSKYWNDYKSKLKKAVVSKASQLKNGEDQSNIKPFLEIEIKYLQLLGQDFGSGLLGLRVEPFEVEPEINNSQISDSSVPVVSDGSVSPVSGLHLVSTNKDEPGTLTKVKTPLSLPTSPPALLISSPDLPISAPSLPASPPRPQATTIIPLPCCLPTPTTYLLPSTTSIQSPHCQPTRQRRTRRKQPISAEEARLILINESRKQTKLQKEKLKMWNVLVTELRELKEIFRQNI